MLNHQFRAQPIVCAACGRATSDRYVTALDRYWHPEHFVCSRCSKPIREESFQSRDGLPYHLPCFAEAFSLLCIACGRACPESYFQDSFGSVFCPECYKVSSSCSFCGRSSPSGKPCAVCVPVVDGSAMATREFETALSWIKGTGVAFPWTLRDIRLSLAADVPATGHTHDAGQRRLGLTEVRWVDNGSGRRYTISVAMRLSLPSLVYRGVAAHELGHVWLLTSGLSHLPNEQAEGFCELLSYLYYRSLKSSEAAFQAKRIRDNPDPIYGGGFRNLVEAHKGLDLPQLTQLLIRSAPSTARSRPDPKWKWNL
jgi:hypothetical protein